MDEIERKQQTAREEARERNRREFPEAARVMDLLKEFEPRLIHWTEGGKTIGRQPQ